MAKIYPGTSLLKLFVGIAAKITLLPFSSTSSFAKALSDLSSFTRTDRIFLRVQTFFGKTPVDLIIQTGIYIKTLVDTKRDIIFMYIIFVNNTVNQFSFSISKNTYIP